MDVLFLTIGIFSGIAVGYLLRKTIALKQSDQAEKKSAELISKTKEKAREILLVARDKSIKVIDEAKREEYSRRKELSKMRLRLEKREEIFDKKILEMENKERKIQKENFYITKIKEKIKEIRDSQIKKLEKIATLTKSKAKNILLDLVEKESEEDLMSRIRKLEKESSEEIDKKAKQLLISAIERCVSAHTAETTTTSVALPNDEMKGRIIGREGRNIKAIEQLTGIEIIIDDTPETLTISGFNPIRRNVAKIAIEKLIKDGRIHPGRIEEAIISAKKELSIDIKKAGEDAIYETGIAGLNPKLIQILGRLKYRTSYGQNVLRHSVEVAQLSAILAEELGANVAVAKKAGLLHDIGKAVDQEIQGTHPEIGRDIAKKFKLPEEVIIPILTHHDDHPPTLEAIIVKIADAISGARQGARKDTYEKYIQRLKELEDIAKNFEGVDKVYAIQAGREIRVFVNSEKVTDLQAHKLAKNIAKEIERELKYPGEIRVNIIREMRVLEYAR
ncbi:MAG: ribonuclease Y [Xanthomonadaceae bacterium]|nr:ribonuclease Y [Rhodospirillaceae bacterium]NIA17705.1 ribonuclease Y [Xanthomonadaceae bacterium]